MERKYNPRLVPLARQLRKQMTKEEKHLWYDFLRGYTPKFLRQKVIGQYIVDFYCAQANIVVELDGSHHYAAQAQEEDFRRTVYLQQFGLSVIRISNCDVNNNFEGVCQMIDLAVKQSLSQPKG